MTDTKCTTPAPERATPKTKPLINHLFWVKDGEIARELQIDVRCLCGVWQSPPGRRLLHVYSIVTAQGDGFLVGAKPSRDCKRCLRVLQARTYRRWREAQR